ncbi:GyrI-like domain-containing protein [Companilactobacillus sp.]|jgi:hypothetical protein|uniref:GyrI-like domain-containing protein n=1 Tax=Companilactobacillus sp. TaxID=2767905 RepID=UPI0025BB242A|nr:GyrI-like domain-containing protein [Companilactobacillus sp.]MCH4010013.1 GyrI-like domain-containing protein [Companilactobacillus sp.]MCH4052311.1 GyrI-like domain-containing protein [Companilactobacillus sp.]MCH4077955.1 GyrI-like domain-containing protein [Companilactobacillus sp.]MCH4126531.1 GyrI-like domain-containing protein [Companilactobacillus sp.]MCH4132117.1 GyrI-like domain-containing protein [Companilactobacillus sp.]
MKYLSKKQERELYLPTTTPKIVNVPGQKFISLHGVGDPNGPEFKEKMETLFPVAYGLKAAYRKYCEGKDVEFDDYVVFPLEGVWSLTEAGQKLDHLDKNEFEYDVMIRIPDFFPADLIEPSIEEIKSKKHLKLINDLEIKEYPAIEAVEVLHVGKYDDEPASFAKMDKLVSEQGKQRASMIHREIYLSDARRVEPERLKTVLRYEIK